MLLSPETCPFQTNIHFELIRDADRWRWQGLIKYAHCGSAGSFPSESSALAAAISELCKRSGNYDREDIFQILLEQGLLETN